MLSGNKLTYAGFGLAALLAVALLWQTNRAEKYQDRYQNSQSNIEALQDSVRTYRNRTDQLVYEKRAYQADRERLAELNDSLSTELEKERGQVKTITKIRTKVKTDTVRIRSVVDTTDGGLTRYNWNFSKRYSPGAYTRLAGWSTKDSTYITQAEIGLSLTTGIRERENQYHIFVRSDHPDVQVTDIEGAVVDPEWYSDTKDRWHVGPVGSIGYGPNGFGSFIGLGVTYSFFSF